MARRRSGAAAFISGLAGGMALGQKWRDISDQNELRGDLADVSKVSETAVASGDEAQKAGLDAYNAALSAAKTPEERARVEQDFAPTMTALEAEKARPASAVQSFGTGRNFRQVADKAELPAAQMAAREGIYRRHGRDEEADRLQDRALNREAAQLNIDAAKDTAETRKKLKTVDQQLASWGEKTFGKDGAVDDDGMVKLGKMRVLLLSQQGLYDDAMKTADQSMKYATAKIQSDQVERQAAVRDAVAMAAQGYFGRAMDVYKRFVPDGANAVSVKQQKDGSIIIERESAVDGAKLPNQTFKDMDQFVSSLNALADSKALTDYIDRTFRRDIDSRRLNIAAAVESRAARKEQKDAAKEAEVEAVRAGLYSETNPKATPTQARAAALGVIPVVPKENGYKTEFSEVSSALGTPAVDANGKPIADVMTGRQVINRNPEEEQRFFKWAQERGYNDTNKALPIYLAEMNRGGGNPQIKIRKLPVEAPVRPISPPR